MPLLAIPFPAFDPILIQIGPLAIRWYALAYIGGLLLGWRVMRALVGDDRLWSPGQPRPSPADLDDLLVYVTFGVIIGGRLGHVLIYGLSYYLANPLEIPQVWRGGMSFHGGLAGVIVALALFSKARGVPLLTVFDLCAVVAPIGLFLGRLANFVNQELWGRPTDVPWAVVFPRAGPLPRHPSQLYEAFAEGVLLFVIIWIVVHRLGFRRPGLAAGLFGLGYAAARTVCEVFREQDASETLWGPLTMGMALSAPLAIAGALLTARALRRPAAALLDIGETRA